MTERADEVRWLVVTIRRVCIMLLGLIGQRYPDLKPPACPHCGRALER